jgi:hypothetical protein
MDESENERIDLDVQDGQQVHPLDRCHCGKDSHEDESTAWLGVNNPQPQRAGLGEFH